MGGKKSDYGKTQNEQRMENLEFLGYDLSKYKFPNKEKLLRNCVPPEIGLSIFQSAIGIYNDSHLMQVGLFS